MDGMNPARLHRRGIDIVDPQVNGLEGFYWWRLRKDWGVDEGVVSD